MNILIVDDSKLIRTVIKSMLIGMGFVDVYEATNGWEAVRKAYVVNPDVVFMNLLMPEMDGFEASRRILHTFEDVKIIIVSSDSYSENCKNLSDIRIQEYITLPIKEERIRGVMCGYEEYKGAY